MTRKTRFGPALAVLLALGFGFWVLRPEPAIIAPSPGTISPGAVRTDFIYGRITTTSGAIHEGRLRWGGDEESLWSNYFNGFRKRNPWVALVPAESLPRERHALEILGVEIGDLERRTDLGRPFMVRFGDLARIEPRGRDIRVILKSGSEFVLDRFSADDLADGVHVWDSEEGLVELGEWRIRSIELLPSPALALETYPLHGTVHTLAGVFTGMIQWNREQTLGSDILAVRTAAGDETLRFDSIRSIARRAGGEALVTLVDGTEIELMDTRGGKWEGRGTYVDDARYGRVLISPEAMERIDFDRGGIGPAYTDFPPGRALTGIVTTRSGVVSRAAWCTTWTRARRRRPSTPRRGESTIRFRSS